MLVQASCYDISDNQVLYAIQVCPYGMLQNGKDGNRIKQVVDEYDGDFIIKRYNNCVLCLPCMQGWSSWL